jgi:hypothetical protein
MILSIKIDVRQPKLEEQMVQPVIKNGEALFDLNFKSSPIS